MRSLVQLAALAAFAVAPVTAATHTHGVNGIHELERSGPQLQRPRNDVRRRAGRDFS